jgi:hypothetical protein
VRQLVARVVHEPAATVRAPAQEPVQRGRIQVPEPLLVLSAQFRRRRADRLTEPGGGLAGRRRQTDPGRRAGLVAEQGQQSRDGRGLAGSGSTREHRDPPQGADRRGQPLPVDFVTRQARSGEQPGQRRTQPGQVDGWRGCREPLLQLLTDLLLLLPVALQVEQAVGKPQRAAAGLLRAVGHQRAGRADRRPILRIRPGQLGQVASGLRLVVSGRGHRSTQRGQIDADRTVPQGPDGQGQGQAYLLVGLLADPPDGLGGVHVGESQDTGGIERGQQPANAVHR